MQAEAIEHVGESASLLEFRRVEVQDLAAKHQIELLQTLRRALLRRIVERQPGDASANQPNRLESIWQMAKLDRDPAEQHECGHDRCWKVTILLGFNENRRDRKDAAGARRPEQASAA